MRILILFVGSALNVQSLSAACSKEQPAFAELIASKYNSVSSPLNVAEIEKENMIEIRETKEVLAFGYANKQWLQFKAAIEPGDKVYFMAHTKNKFYLDGHILVRKGCVVQFLKGAIS